MQNWNKRSICSIKNRVHPRASSNKEAPWVVSFICQKKQQKTLFCIRLGLLWIKLSPVLTWLEKNGVLDNFCWRITSALQTHTTKHQYTSKRDLEMDIVLSARGKKTMHKTPNTHFDLERSDCKTKVHSCCADPIKRWMWNVNGTTARQKSAQMEIATLLCLRGALLWGFWCWIAVKSWLALKREVNLNQKQNQTECCIAVWSPFFMCRVIRVFIVQMAH